MTPQDDNANHLRARFAAELLRHRPKSVLDIGCGSGHLLRACRRVHVDATGYETDPACREAVTAARFNLLDLTPDGTFAAADNTFDWVALRHVPHHLADPRGLLAEAFRLARAGVVLAEPWFDRSIPSQAVADDIDNWLKREHRRLGRVHEPNITIDRLLGFVPEGEIFGASWEYYVRLRARPLHDVTDEAERYLADSPDAAEFDELVARARRDGLSCNGSLVVTLRR